MALNTCFGAGALASRRKWLQRGFIGRRSRVKRFDGVRFSRESDKRWVLSLTGGGMHG
jgi:hypothetical protein